MPRIARPQDRTEALVALGAAMAPVHRGAAVAAPLTLTDLADDDLRRVFSLHNEWEYSEWPEQLARVLRPPMTTEVFDERKKGFFDELAYICTRSMLATNMKKDRILFCNKENLYKVLCKHKSLFAVQSLSSGPTGEFGAKFTSYSGLLAKLLKATRSIVKGDLLADDAGPYKDMPVLVRLFQWKRMQSVVQQMFRPPFESAHQFLGEFEAILKDIESNPDANEICRVILTDSSLFAIPSSLTPGHEVADDDYKTKLAELFWVAYDILRDDMEVDARNPLFAFGMVDIWFSIPLLARLRAWRSYMLAHNRHHGEDHTVYFARVQRAIGAIDALAASDYWSNSADTQQMVGWSMVLTRQFATSLYFWAIAYEPSIDNVGSLTRRTEVARHHINKITDSRVLTADADIRDLEKWSMALTPLALATRLYDWASVPIDGGEIVENWTGRMKAAIDHINEMIMSLVLTAGADIRPLQRLSRDLDALRDATLYPDTEEEEEGFDV